MTVRRTEEEEPPTPSSPSSPAGSPSQSAAVHRIHEISLQDAAEHRTVRSSFSASLSSPLQSLASLGHEDSGGATHSLLWARRISTQDCPSLDVHNFSHSDIDFTGGSGSTSSYSSSNSRCQREGLSSFSSERDKFRTSNLLNSKGQQVIRKANSNSPLPPSTCSSSQNSPEPQRRRSFSKIMTEFQAVTIPSPEASSLLRKAFTIRTEDIHSPTKVSAALDASSGKSEDGKANLYAMSKFSSTLVLEHVRRIGAEKDATSSSSPSSSVIQCDNFDGVAMIVDVSGFTKMCEEFGKGIVDPSEASSSVFKKEDVRAAETFATSMYRNNNEQEAYGRGGER